MRGRRCLVTGGASGIGLCDHWSRGGKVVPDMYVKAAINGGRARGEHPGVPVTPEEIADVATRVGVLADAVHLHPRSKTGEQSIEPDDLRHVIDAVRGRQRAVPVGVTTGLWCCANDAVRRLELVEAWDVLPDFASAAYAEEGAEDVAAVLVAKGVALESAVWSTDDIPVLLRSHFLEDNIRILIEPMEEDPDQAVAHAREMADRLIRAGVRCPLLFHGEGATVWPVLRAGAQDGHQVRIGLEDGILMPDGSVAADNVELVVATRAEVARVAADRPGSFGTVPGG